jgi:hypothetical protein
LRQWLNSSPALQDTAATDVGIGGRCSPDVMAKCTAFETK